MVWGWCWVRRQPGGQQSVGLKLSYGWWFDGGLVEMLAWPGVQSGDCSGVRGVVDEGLGWLLAKDWRSGRWSAQSTLDG